MITKENLENTARLLKEHNQAHLLAFCNDLSDSEKISLLAQIHKLDFNQIDRWVENYVKNPAPCPLPADIAPAPSYPPVPTDPDLTGKYRQARLLGQKLLAQGKVAPFVVGGGQGTRLGFDGPKGSFPIGPVSNKTLFQLFAEFIAASAKKYRRPCPWYIMTSSLNHAQTRETFESNNFFGLNPADVFLLQQGTLPCFDLAGKILLADKAALACSPDGHGGSLKALYESGAINDMKKRGIELISYFQIDNPLVNLLDPLFIGLHALDNAEMSSKALKKTGPNEKVGNFCLADGKVSVIEYSDLPSDLAQKRNSDGSLAFELGSIAIHLINVAFIEKLNSKGFSLPLHRAVKKIPHIDPAEPNGVKLETFVFDALPLASKSVILQTIRSQEFAPVKNAAGVDSAQSARQMLIARAADWLSSVGVHVPQKPDGSPDCTIEIAPSFALEKEDLRQKLNRIPKINAGDSLYLA